MRAKNLAARVLEGAGPRLSRALSGPSMVDALERCLGSALEAFLACLGVGRSDVERRHLGSLFKTWFAHPDVGRELGTLLRGRRLSVKDLEFLLSEHLADSEKIPPEFYRALSALEATFLEAIRSEPDLREVEFEPSAQGALPEGHVDADLIWARTVVGSQFNFLFASRPGGERSVSEEDVSLHDAYLHRLMESAGSLALGGVDPAVAGSESDAALRLDAVYTALSTQTPRDRPTPADAARPVGAKDPERSSALEQLDRNSHLVLLGDPGSGKSTFVDFVSLCLAGELLGSPRAHLELLTAPLDEEDKDGGDKDGGGEGGEAAGVRRPCWSHGALLPVRIVLRDFAARGLSGDPGTADVLWRFLQGELERASLADFAPRLKETLHRDGGLVLLDGLDEVPEAEGRRRQILQAVRDFAAAFHRCRFLVTCRTYAYQHQRWRLPGFTEVVLAPFNEAQIGSFVDRWYAHVAQLRGFAGADAQGRAEELKAAIFASERLRPLAERPLLLTLMASLHAWRGGNLPERREELYHDAVQLLLDFWEQRRVVKDASGRPVVQQESLAEWLRVDRARVRRLLNEMAYHAHASQENLEGTADLAERDLVARLMRIADNPDARPARLVEYLRDRAGLLLARGIGIYTFPHRTFQEYLAACHLTDHDFPEGLAELARRDKERWREVTLLAAAKASRGSAVSPWHLADALSFRGCDHDRHAAEDVHGAHLAGLVLTETVDLRKPAGRLESIRDRVRSWQEFLLRGADLPALDRVECGRSLARLGEVRPEVTSVDRMQFCWVPRGGFRMGAEESALLSWGNDRPASDAPISYGFWIGRYPVTQAQFRVFVEAGGYREERYWLEALEAGQWRDGRLTIDGSVCDGPLEFPPPFSLPNHPVVGVSWFEAQAFCRWMTERLRVNLAKFWKLGLPSEPEWEKSARGGFEIPSEPILVEAEGIRVSETPGVKENPQPARQYPWGEELGAEEANWAGIEVGSTSAVGCFPKGRSPYGCEDMSGNVWEWSRSQYEGYPYPKSDLDRAQREGGKSDAARVLRGGSFINGADNLRSSARLGDAPATRHVNVGFRVVISPSGL